MSATMRMAIMGGAVGCLLLTLFILKPGWKRPGEPDTLYLWDKAHRRLVPVLLYSENIDSGKNRKVVILAHGLGIRNSDYAYISSHLAAKGFIVASVQYGQPGDKEPDRSGNIYEALKPVWDQSDQSILFAIHYLKNKYPNLDCQNLTLIGHSRGGDVLALFAQEYPEMVSKLISLDNGHMPLPRTIKPQVFSLRAYNTTPDKGVLPTPEEQKEFNITIVELQDISHIEMCFGTEAQKEEMIRYIDGFLNKE
jgi:pimeloyl-ACP methyl ester carboxylesterase